MRHDGRHSDDPRATICGDRRPRPVAWCLRRNTSAPHRARADTDSSGYGGRDIRSRAADSNRANVHRGNCRQRQRPARDRHHPTFGYQRQRWRVPIERPGPHLRERGDQHHRQYAITGNTREFDFEFPATGEFQIEDVTFNAEDLLPGASTPLFSIGVNVHARPNFVPPATVVHPNQTDSGDSGTARRSESGGTTTLIVDGVNEHGDTIHLEAICGPR